MKKPIAAALPVAFAPAPLALRASGRRHLAARIQRWSTVQGMRR